MWVQRALLTRAVGLGAVIHMISCGQSSPEGTPKAGPSVDAGSQADVSRQGTTTADGGTGGSGGANANVGSVSADSGAADRTDADTDSNAAAAFPNLLFDDFSYADSSDPALTQFGWTLKSGSGAPGPANAVWSPSNVSFLMGSSVDGGADSGSPNNRLMRLTSSTQGTTTVSQAEACHQFILLEGTYATRVRFVDTAFSGVSTDQISETFFSISAPDTRDMGNPLYSECDFEYFPTGAFGYPQGLQTVTWESYDYTDAQDLRNNQFTVLNGSYQGWHTVTFVVMNGNVVYSVDGTSVATHGGPNYPESLMAPCFNLWVTGVPAAGQQTWVQDVDWVLHAKGQDLTAADAERKVAELRAAQFTRLNTIR